MINVTSLQQNLPNRLNWSHSFPMDEYSPIRLANRLLNSFTLTDPVLCVDSRSALITFQSQFYFARFLESDHLVITISAWDKLDRFYCRNRE